MSSALSRDEAKHTIREAGLRATAPRVAVLRALSAADKPLSHGEVVKQLGIDDWDQATLYRNLLKLVEVNLARVVSNVGGVVRYEARRHDEGPHLHPHFACRECGFVSCLRGAKLAGRVDRRWSEALAGSEMQLVGDCPDCLARRKRTSKKKRRRA